MIASVRGSIQAVGSGWVIVETGGVGYRVHVPQSRPVGAVGDEVFLHTVLDVREDSLDLYGFFTDDQQQLFRALVEVPRVGGRLALRVLSHLAPAEIIAAVEQKDSRRFSSLPGVGESLAERIVMDLKRRIKKLTLSAPVPGAGTPSHVEQQAQDALKALGYRSEEIRAALAWVDENTEGALALGDLVRRALHYFQKDR